MQIAKMPLAPTDVNRHRTTDQGARVPAFFPNSPDSSFLRGTFLRPFLF